MMSPRVLACLLLLTLTPPGHTQAAPAAATANPAYSGESIVIEHLDTIDTFAADGTGVTERTLAVRIQSEAALRELGVIHIPFAGNSQRVEFVYVRTRRPDGTVVDTPFADALDMPAPVTRDAPFYSDLKQKQLPVRSLRVGDTLEWKARVIRTKAEAPGEFWGQEDLAAEGTVSLSETIELRVPKGKYVKVWSPTSTPKESDEGTTHIYGWTSSQLKPTTGKEADAAREAKKKEVWTAAQELDDREGKLPAIAWTTFKSWPDVGAWYAALEEGRTAPDADIKAKVAELIAGKTTDEDKVRAIYGFVSTQLRYIGVAFGIGRYQPHAAPEILANQYGDCKDKHTLLAAMLGVAGFHADAVLIGAGIRFNDDVPSPASFNHLITQVPVDGHVVWLDSTAEIAPYRMLFAIIRDHQALVVPASGIARIERTPANPPFASFETMNATGILDQDGVSNSRLTFTLRGDDELSVRSTLRQVAPAQYGQLVQQIANSMGYAGTTSNPDISRPEDTATPLTISYDYKRDKGGDWANYKIIPQLIPLSIPRPDEKDPPVRAIQLGTPRAETSTAAMKLPEGWAAELPEAVHAKCAYATYDITYRFDKGTVYTERRVQYLQDKVPVADWKTYKKFTDAANLDESYIQLTRHTTGVDNSSSDKRAVLGSAAPPINFSAQATILIRSAFTAIQNGDLATARKSLDEAATLSLSHDLPDYWATHGFLQIKSGQILDGIAEYHKELTLHPAETRYYPYLISQELAAGYRDKAMGSLRSWIAADPANPTPDSQLIGMLLDDGDNADAITEADAASARLPEDKRSDPRFQTLLGRAQIASGSPQKGDATLTALLKSSEDSLTLNNAAYYLADAGLEMPLAEAASRTALDQLNAKSNTWTLDETPATLRSGSSLIFSSWDTLGWILYREGKLAEAESYLAAAWRNAVTAEKGQHLGAVQIARGNKVDALATYQQTLADLPAYNAMGVRVGATPQSKDLEARIAALRKAGVTGPDQAKIKPQALRTIPLGPAGGLSGNAEYRLLLKADGVQKAQPTGEKSIAGGEKAIAKGKFDILFPAGSNAVLVHTGVLNCHSGICELILTQ
jgi:tetratricopeptide (TPR) repeat protein